MIIHRRDAQGRPRDIELTEAEALVKEIHSNLMDRGLDQGEALIHMTGADLPHRNLDLPFLNAALSDLEFRSYLVD